MQPTLADHDLYGLLGVHPGASAEEIRLAYRQRAMLWHPDRNNCADAEETFKLIRSAYEVLRDPSRRSDYDRNATSRAERARPTEPPASGAQRRRDISNGGSRASFPRHGYDGEANDANAGGRGADAAAEGCGAGDQTHRAQDGLLQEHRTPLPARWWLGGVQATGAPTRVARAGAVVERAVAAASGQRRCGTPGS